MAKRTLWLVTSLWLGACAGKDTDSEADAEPAQATQDGGSSAAQDANSGGSSDAARDDAAAPLDGSSPSPRDGGGNRNDADAPTPQRDAQASQDGSTTGPTPDASTPSASTYKLDCGASGIALESAGPPKNRVNYVIAGDGYTTADLETTYVKHLNEMLRVRFLPALEPYTRYRKFINICALKVPSNTSGVGTTRGDTAFGGYGNDETRLGYIEDAKVRDAMTRLLPKEIEVDWVGVVLNGNRWWNAGGRYMVWSGAHKDAGLAAMHEGGHSFQQLADEYGGNCTYSGDEARMRINVTKDATNTAGKWSKWLDLNHNPGTGMQGTFEGAEYCDKGAFRPSKESVMNSLWNSSYFNAISLEQAVRVIYNMVKPIDSSTPATTTTTGVLTVEVVDPAVIKLEWFVDDKPEPKAQGGKLDVAALGLTPGSHTVRARAFDDTPWVRGDRKTLEQSVSWTIQVP